MTATLEPPQAVSATDRKPGKSWEANWTDQSALVSPPESWPSMDLDYPCIRSPRFQLEKGWRYFFFFRLALGSRGKVEFSLLRGTQAAQGRTILGEKDLLLALEHRPRRSGRFHLLLSCVDMENQLAMPWQRMSLQIFSLPAKVSQQTGPLDTFLPHWTGWQRTLHRLCRSSRLWNSAINRLEMALEREELLSLPRYVALCPTGQCNALCAFCSVTTGRTGIVKKQLTHAGIDRLVDPLANVVELFGLEGNGEPTLFDEFPELVAKLTAEGSPSYLITNGERLNDRLIALLLAAPVDSINFSLNAATAETHRRVMKLKGFAEVTENIRKLVRWRGENAHPTISVSFVVNRENVHEVVEFLALAEWDLMVDRIYVRPLSEIANEDGSVEDLRDLVPYEQDIEDMLDGVEEYLELVPRRSEIHLIPDNFRAFRPNPFRGQVPVCGREGELFAPRASGWKSLQVPFSPDWKLNRLVFDAGSGLAAGPLLESSAVPLGSDCPLTFRFHPELVRGSLDLEVLGEDGKPLALARIGAVPGEMELLVEPGNNRQVSFRIHAREVPLAGQIAFARLRTPAKKAPDFFQFPHPDRWQTETPGVQLRWEGEKLRLEAEAPPSLYLVKSYGISCEINREISLEFPLEVSRGKLGLGILSGDGTRWISQHAFPAGAKRAKIAFHSGNEERVQVVLYALQEGKLDCVLDFTGQLEAKPQHRERAIRTRDLLLPGAKDWQIPASTPEGAVALGEKGKRLEINFHYKGQPYLYLTQTPPLPCLAIPNGFLRLPLKLEVKSGVLGIGFLSEDGRYFVGKKTFLPGLFSKEVMVNTGREKKLSVLFYSSSAEPLIATVSMACLLEKDIGDFLPSQAQKNLSRFLFQNINNILPLKKTTIFPQSMGNRLQKVYRQEGIEGIINRLENRLPSIKIKQGLEKISQKLVTAVIELSIQKFRKNRLYCSKPWTDLNNFTVDGRMDVCCIATGPSQKRYALGNLFANSFQEIWNGKQAREFRKTVNTTNKLPPCARCPMAKTGF